MAVAFVQGLGSNQNKASGSSIAIAPLTNTVAGNLLVVLVALDPNTTVSSVTDTPGNTYTKAGAVTNGSGTSGVRTEIWASKSTFVVNNSTDQIVVHFAAAVVSKATVGLEFSGADNVADVAA